MSTYAGEGLPPELAALMGGGGGDPMAGAAPDPMSAGAPAPGQDADGEDTVAILERMIADAQKYLGVEQDEEDKLTMTKVLQQLQQYKANEQKETDDLLGGKVSPRALRRVAGGGAA